MHLENLIENYPLIIATMGIVTNIQEQIEDCRKAVKAANDFKMKISEDENKCST